jgi:L-threonylcarbamoyladenylate synthase
MLSWFSAAIATAMTGSSPLTQVLPFDEAAIAKAAALITADACVAMPTETVYGLAADATSDKAVAGIYAAKGRPSFNPLIVHVADLAMAEALADFSPEAHSLADQLWPGPLTLVLPSRATSTIAAAVTAGLRTIALRCPAHAAMHALIRVTGRPLAAPSANASGSVSPTTAEHVLATLNGRIPMIIDGGACTGGLESTIVAVDQDHISVLRPGPITTAMLTAATGLPVVGTDHHAEITAPGQLASHYAPGKPVLLNVTQPTADAFVIGFGAIDGDFQLSATGDLTEAAELMFAALHAGRDSNKPRIAVAPIPDEGIGIAINDRLRRSAA